MWVKRNLFVFLFFILATFLVTFPLIFHLTNYIVGTGDELLINWIINWNIHAFLTNPLKIFNTNIFFPYQNTLAFSDLLWLQSLISAPFILIFKEPLLGFNISLLAGFILTGFSLYLLIKQISGNFLAAFVGAVVLTFSPIHLDFLSHQQLFNVWPVTFSWYFLIRKKYLWYVVFFVLSSWSTPLFAQFLIVISLFYREFIPLFFALFFTAPFLIPYFLVSRQWHYIRPITDAIHYSLQIPDLVNPGSFSRLGEIVSLPYSSHYFGLGIIVFVFLGAKNFIWKNKIFLIAATGFILALGPALHIFRTTIHVGPIPAIPLPYTIFYYLIPGFSGFRTPSRWILLCVISLVVLAAKKINKKFAILLILITFLELNLPLKFIEVPKINQYPPEVNWLKNNYVNEPLIYFPVYNWDDLNQKNYETERMLFSTTHWHPMFNGYSGFTPEERQKQIKWLQKEFPSVETISFLKSIGIKLVIAPSSWKSKMSVFPQMRIISEFPKEIIYHL